MQASLLLAIPLLVGNLWHGLMPLVGRKKSDFKNSISENALRSKQVLLIHRAVHLVLSACFFIYSIYLFNEGLIVASVLLTLAALFDSIQVITLSKYTNHTPMYFRDIHQAFAWLMAMTYLVFSVVFAIDQKFSELIIWAYIIYLVCICMISFYVKHSYFWFIQMAYFVSVSAVMAGLAVFYG